jgi:hypothetical protein
MEGTENERERETTFKGKSTQINANGPMSIK